MRPSIWVVKRRGFAQNICRQMNVKSGPVRGGAGLRGHGGDKFRLPQQHLFGGLEQYRRRRSAGAVSRHCGKAAGGGVGAAASRRARLAAGATEAASSAGPGGVG